MKFSTFNLRHQLVMPAKKNRDGMTLVQQNTMDKHNERARKRPPMQCKHCPKQVKNMTQHVMKVHPHVYKSQRNYRKNHGWPGSSYSVVSQRVWVLATKDHNLNLLTKNNREILAKVMDWIRDQLGDRLHKSDRGEACFDDTGIYMRSGFWLHHHSLFSLSLDRKDKKKNHFDLDEQGKLVCNVRLVMSGINHRTNISDLPDLPSFVRTKLNEKFTQEQVDLLLDKRRSSKNMMYVSVNHVWQSDRDEKPREHFDSLHAFFDYCFDLARKQRMVWGGRYGILMSDTYATPKGKRYFAPSLSAIDPRKGHIPGNLEWIPACFNNTCSDKKKTVNDDDDPNRQPTQWTIKLVRECFGTEWDRRIANAIERKRAHDRERGMGY